MDVTRKEVLTSKSIIGIVSIVCLFIVKEYGVPHKEVECIEDPTQESLSYLNSLVNSNPTIAKFFQISSSLLMDFVFLSLFTYWIINVQTGRPIYAVGLFYTVRGLTQSLVVLRFPVGYIWNDPGIPSLVVPYGRSSDFFFSGHCGFLNLCALEWLRNGKKEYFKAVQGINAYLAFVMLVFRIHYLIDIATAVFFSHYIFLFIEWNLPLIDSYAIRYYNLIKLKILQCQRPPKNEQLMNEVQLQEPLNRTNLLSTSSRLNDL